MASATKTWIEVDFTSQVQGLVWARRLRALGRTPSNGSQVLAFDRMEMVSRVEQYRNEVGSGTARVRGRVRIHPA